MTEENKEKEMTPEERLVWLRERGIFVETSEDRKIKQIKDIMNEKDDIINGEKYEDLKFVHVPHDESLPMKELSMKVPERKIRMGKGDLLIEELKPFFKSLSNKVDMSLFQGQATKTLGSSGDDIQVSHEALKQVAEQGQVESFTLVQPMHSNKFQSVNIYLDEAGMLKRLPMNKRAADIALRAGFNPAPKFYGDIFLGRVTKKPVLMNVDFKLGADTSPNAEWIKNATMENLEYQTEMNKITGQGDQLQASADGENGIAKAEQGGLYTWTQTDEEIEIILPLGSGADGQILSSKDVKANGLKVKYFPRKLLVSFRNEELLCLKLFSSVDTDGCTWTLDIGEKDKETSLIITCEKVDGMSWPRVTL